jgi:putative transposase
MCAKDGSGEVSLSSYEHFASRDALGVVMLERMLADVSTRRFVRSQEPVGPGGRGAGTLDVEVLDLRSSRSPTPGIVTSSLAADSSAPSASAPSAR